MNKIDEQCDALPVTMTPSIPVVISLCDNSGVMVQPWAAAGCECWCVDVQHSIRQDKQVGNVRYVWGDIRSWAPPENVAGRVAILFAFPPCTHVAVSGARDFRAKGNYMLRDALELFSACETAARWAGVPYMIEKPGRKVQFAHGRA